MSSCVTRYFMSQGIPVAHCEPLVVVFLSITFAGLVYARLVLEFVVSCLSLVRQQNHLQFDVWCLFLLFPLVSSDFLI